MTPFPKCEACPVRAAEAPCHAQATNHRRFCDHVARGTPGYRELVYRETAAGSPAPSEFPPLLEQAANLAGAVGRFVASGLKTTTPEEQARRLGICATCPEFVGGKCRRCGCFLMAKVRSAAEHCPLDPPRW